MSASPAGAGLASVSPRSRGWSLLAGLTVALAGVVVVDTDVSASTGTPALAASGSPALASAQKRCRTVRVKLKRHGKVVKRNGKPVFRKVRRCKRVPSPGCRFVKVKKRKKNGKVVKRHGKPVYIKVERCPPKPTQPGPGPAPGTQPGPGPAPGPQPGPTPTPSPTPTAAELANLVLSRDPHRPANVNLFTSDFDSGRLGAYPEGTPMAPASGPDPSESETRAQLVQHLQDQFDGDTAQINESLALYDSPDVAARISDPTLRAAFAALNGTLWEPTIDHFLNSGLLTTVAFGLLGIPDSIAESVSNGDGTRRVVFNIRYDREDFALQVMSMGHEFLHDDTAISNAEEAHLHAIQAMVHAQVLSKHHGLAYGATELTRRANTFVLAFFNSREAGSPNSEIVAPTGKGVYPAGQFAAADFWTLLSGGGSSPAPEPLRMILESIFAPGTPIPATLNFDQATAELFANLNDNWLNDTQRAQISVLLQLVTVDEIAQATGISQQQIIDTLGLQPYLDAIGS